MVLKQFFYIITVMKFLLLTGIPGTGKTEIGNHLAAKFGFVHLDVEDTLPKPNSETILNETIANCINENKDLVITWGFMPVVDDQSIASLRAAGAKLVWFDGDRPSARKAFIERGTVPEGLLDNQMAKIEKIDVASVYNPIFYNTLDENGVFKSKDQMSHDLIVIAEDP